MADDSLPYLGDIAITPKLPCTDDIVHVTVTWTVKSIQPNVVEIYAYFGTIEGNLLDRGNIIGTYSPAQALVSFAFTRINHDPFLYIGVAPRNVEDGLVTDTMPDATGEPTPWDNLVTKQGMEITYTHPPQHQVPPPVVQVSSIVKTLWAGDHLEVTVIGANSDRFNLIVSEGGQDDAQISSSDGTFPPIPSTPGKKYFLRAEQHNKGSGSYPPAWSLFSTPTPIVALPHVRSLRSFLAISSVLKPGASVRQYTGGTGGSTRAMMGI